MYLYKKWNKDISYFSVKIETPLILHIYNLNLNTILTS
jgi:hypothetical protein